MTDEEEKKPTRLKPKTERYTAGHIVNKLSELVKEDSLDRVLVILWRKQDGAIVEHLMGCDKVSRLDLLSAEQTVRMVGDAVYRNMVALGHSERIGKPN